MEAVVLNGLTKHYGKEKTIAVDRVTLSINKGELFGLIGPDGAGKTSIFRMLTTLLLPDGGSAAVTGYDIVKNYREIRHTVGYMPGKFSLYQDLTVEENLNFFASVFGTTIQTNYHLIQEIYSQLERFKKRPAGKLSGGMKQKLALCCALIHKPTVLFLDEPTTGVDPVSRKEFWEILKRLKKEDITIVVSTPYMDEATLCDRIALIQAGKILSVDEPDEIIAAFPEALYAINTDDMYGTLKFLERLPFVTSCYAFGEYAHVTLDQADAITRLEEAIKTRRQTPTEIKPIRPTVEDCFIKLLKN